MRLVIVYIAIFSIVLLLSACIPGEQETTPAIQAASPIPKSTLGNPTATSTLKPIQAAETSATPAAVIDTSTPLPSPTSPSPPSKSPIPPDWQIYSNQKYGFELSYPPGGALVEDEPDHARIDLPFQPNTTLQEKYLSVDTAVPQADGTCSSPFASGYAPEAIQRETVNVGEQSFLRESGSEGAAGSTYEWTAYSSVRGQNCASLTFVLHSTNAANYDVPPPEFDPSAEKEVYEQVVATFQWQE